MLSLSHSESPTYGVITEPMLLPGVGHIRGNEECVYEQFVEVYIRIGRKRASVEEMQLIVVESKSLLAHLDLLLPILPRNSSFLR